MWTNQPAYSQWGGGGPHDAIVCDTLGVVRTSGANNVGQDGIGSTTATTTGAFVTVTTDNNGSTLPPMAGYLMTLNPTNGENWFTVLRSTVATGGLVYVAGCTQDGISGDGTSGSATQTKFKLITMPNSDTIVKIEGFQMVLALSNHDSVLSWGANNYNYALGQGNTPVSNAPGYIHLPTGWHAYDIGSGGIFSWILADSGNHVYHKIFSWGWQYDPGYQGLGASGTVHTTPTDVTSNAFMSPANKRRRLQALYQTSDQTNAEGMQSSSARRMLLQRQQPREENSSVYPQQLRSLVTGLERAQSRP